MSVILLATLPSLSAPHFLDPVVAAAVRHATARLVIVLFSRHFNVHHNSGAFLNFPEHQAVSRTKSWDAVQRILAYTYVQATKAAWEQGKVLLDIDILLTGLNEDLDPDIGADMDICFRVSGDAMAVPLPLSVSLLRQSYISPGPHSDLPTSHTGTPSPSETSIPALYPVTALGGTFDHLHAGHKILLSMAAWITKEKLIVGITDDELLKNKANKHVLEPISVRTERVRKFLHFFKPEIALDLVPITDVYGPTGWDPNIQALVVSKETLSGSDAIAKHRASKSLPPLHTFLIDVISATSSSLEHANAEWLKNNKLSSTFIRQWVVDNVKTNQA